MSDPSADHVLPSDAPAGRPRLTAEVLLAFDALVARRADEHRVPAVVAAIVSGGRVLHTATGGPEGAAASSTSVYRIASMTKSFTAAAVLLLRDRGLLALDDAVAGHVPELAGLRPPTADSPPVTIRQLLTMASGLATDDAWADRHLDDTPAALDTLFRAGGTFAHPPGTTMEYSNYGYAMLGRVIESVTGTTCSAFISEHLLAPLGMTRTVWDPARLPREASGDVMVGHRVEDEEVVVDRPAPLGDGGFAPMGGLWSCADDLARWVGSFCDAFPPRDDVDPFPLRRSSRREQQQVHRPYGAPVLRHAGDGSGVLRQVGLGYAMGLQRMHHLSMGDVVAHSGGLPGFGSNMRWLPHRDIGVVALGNVTYAPMVELTHELLELLDDLGALPETAPSDVSPQLRDAIDALVALVNEWDDERAAALFADNVDLDESLARRAATAKRVNADHGRLVVESISPLSRTEGDVSLRGEVGRLTLEVQLSPTVPPLVQWYELTSTKDEHGPGHLAAADE